MIRSFLFCVFLVAGLWCAAQNKIVVFQSDFGLKDGAVSEMKGVAMGVSPELKLFDLTHEIPAYNIWEAAYRVTAVCSVLAGGYGVCLGGGSGGRYVA